MFAFQNAVAFSPANIDPATHRGKKHQHQSLKVQIVGALQKDELVWNGGLLQKIRRIRDLFKTSKAPCGDVIRARL